MKDIKGEIVFDTDMLDVTDPCYDKDTWCRCRVPIVAGKYEYRAKVVNYHGWGERISELRIVKEDADCIPMKGKEVAAIGADAGMAGFFADKPDYNDDKWNEICDFIFADEFRCFAVDESTPLGCVGVFSSSGIGDGGYPVYELLDNDGHRCGYAIEFLED